MAEVPGWIIAANFRRSCRFRLSMVSLRRNLASRWYLKRLKTEPQVDRDLKDCCDLYLNHAQITPEIPS